jgi:hypothetical protein
MKEWVDELSGEDHKLWQLRFERGVHGIIFLGCQIKVLLQLGNVRLVARIKVNLTLKRFFSSLRDLSFFSRSLFKLLLCRS